jgi:hypothetical protein
LFSAVRSASSWPRWSVLIGYRRDNDATQLFTIFRRWPDPWPGAAPHLTSSRLTGWRRSCPNQQSLGCSWCTRLAADGVCATPSIRDSLTTKPFRIDVSVHGTAGIMLNRRQTSCVGTAAATGWAHFGRGVSVRMMERKTRTRGSSDGVYQATADPVTEVTPGDN